MTRPAPSANQPCTRQPVEACAADVLVYPVRKRAKLIRRDTDGLVIRACKECQREFWDAGRQDFCCARCRYAFANRRKKRGEAVIDIVMRIRRSPRDNAALSDLWHVAAAFIADDRAAGRESW